MTYYDINLKFTDVTEMRNALYDLDGGGQRTLPKYAAIDIIGIFHKKTGRQLPDPITGAPFDETLPMVGWFVNVRHTAPMPELDTWFVDQSTPMRAWF